MWEGGPPADILAMWAHLRGQLLYLDQNWWVWIRWYEDRLYGASDLLSRSLIMDLELARILEPTEEDWKKGPAHVNAMLAALEERYRRPSIKVPQQDPAAIQYLETPDGTTSIDREAVLDRVSRDPNTQKLYERAKSRIHILRDTTVDQREGTNQPNRLNELAAAIELAMGKSIDDIDPYDLVSEADELESDLHADDDRRADKSELSGEKLPPDQRTALRNASNALQRLINLAPPLAGINVAVHATVEVELDTYRVKMIVSSGVEDGVFDPEIQDRLEAEIKKHPKSRYTLESFGNLIRSVAKGVWTTGKPILKQWFEKYEKPILSAVRAIPGLDRTLRAIYEYLTGRGLPEAVPEDGGKVGDDEVSSDEDE